MKKALPTLLMLAALLTLPTTASAAEFGFFGVEVRGGAIFPEDLDTGYTLGVALNVGQLTDGLYLYPAVVYSEADDSQSFGGPFGNASVDFEITSLAVGAEVRYFPSGAQDGFYFGGGPYFHFLEAKASAAVNAPFPLNVSVNEDSNELGATGVAGYRFSGGRSAFFVEGRYVVVTDFNSGQVLVGFSF